MDSRADFGGFPDSMASGRKRIFSIVAPAVPADRGRKTIRRIWIFDSHPDSLQLVSRSLNNDDELAPARRRILRDLILGLGLGAGLALAIFWLVF